MFLSTELTGVAGRKAHDSSYSQCAVVDYSLNIISPGPDLQNILRQSYLFNTFTVAQNTQSVSQRTVLQNTTVRYQGRKLHLQIP